MAAFCERLPALPVPPDGAGKLWVGHGNGRRCDACDEAITTDGLTL